MQEYGRSNEQAMYLIFFARKRQHQSVRPVGNVFPVLVSTRVESKSKP